MTNILDKSRIVKCFRVFPFALPERKGFNADTCFKHHVIGDISHFYCFVEAPARMAAKKYGDVRIASRLGVTASPATEKVGASEFVLR